jgi:hypothetical protein
MDFDGVDTGAGFLAGVSLPFTNSASEVTYPPGRTQSLDSFGVASTTHSYMETFLLLQEPEGCQAARSESLVLKGSTAMSY